jgi:hypothetical protein
VPDKLQEGGGGVGGAYLGTWTSPASVLTLYSSSPPSVLPYQLPETHR